MQAFYYHHLVLAKGLAGRGHRSRTVQRAQLKLRRRLPSMCRAAASSQGQGGLERELDCRTRSWNAPPLRAPSSQPHGSALGTLPAIPSEIVENIVARR